MVHMIQNAGTVQALYGIPGSKDRAEFNHTASLYAVLIFISPKLDLCMPKFACIRHILKGMLLYIFIY